MFFLYATAKTISDIFACFSYYPRHPEKGKWTMRALAANTPTRFGSYFEFFYVLLLVKKKDIFILLLFLLLCPSIQSNFDYHLMI